MQPPPPPTETQTPPPPPGTKVHKVIVAPTKGVLRYVPFTLKVNPGDTIEYLWGAGESDLPLPRHLERKGLS